MKVYLSGPMKGCTDEEMHGWRNRAKWLLKDVQCLDPTDRDYRGRDFTDANLAREIVEQDLKDVRNADCLLVKASGTSWGTPMEVMYARMVGVRVVAFGAGGDPSPWLVHHAEVCQTLEEACDRVLGRS